MKLSLQLNFSWFRSGLLVGPTIEAFGRFWMRSMRWSTVREYLRGCSVAASTDVIGSSYHFFCWEADGPFK